MRAQMIVAFLIIAGFVAWNRSNGHQFLVITDDTNSQPGMGGAARQWSENPGTGYELALQGEWVMASPILKTAEATSDAFCMKHHIRLLSLFESQLDGSEPLLSGRGDRGSGEPSSRIARS